MTYEIRAMSIGEVLDTGFRLVRDHFVIFLGIGLTLSLPASLLSLLTTEMANDPTWATLGSLVAAAIFFLLVSPVVSAAITHAVSEAYLNREVTYGASIRFGFKLLLPLLGTAILMTLIVLVGLVLLIIPGIYLIVAFTLTYQVMVVENRAGWDALKRTRGLSSGNLIRIVAVYAVAMVLMIVVSSGLSLVTMGTPVLATVVSAVVQAIFTAYLAAALVVIYFDIRCRKEAFDLEYLARRVSGEAGAAPIAG